MLRKNGNFTFYQIEEYQSKWDRWVLINQFYLKEYEFGEHTSCGKCWQGIGIHGIFDLEYAKTYCNKLNELASTEKLNDIAEVTKFRVVEVNISQSKTVLECIRY